MANGVSVSGRSDSILEELQAVCDLHVLTLFHTGSGAYVVTQEGGPFMPAQI